jgi:hypothetical protein
MRVTRRTRPSQVGHGASIGRRRLLHTQANDSASDAESHDQGSMVGLTMVVRLDFHDASETPGEPDHAFHGDRRQTQQLAAAASSDGGR